jgi:hypothetical protein
MEPIRYYNLTECASIKGINNTEMKHRIIQAGLSRLTKDGRSYLLTTEQLNSIDLTRPLVFGEDLKPYRPYFDAINKNNSTSDDFILITNNVKVMLAAKRLGYIEFK